MAATPSSWRPPWLETITPAAPRSAASTASSAVITPLTRTGRLESETSASRSAQPSAGSTRREDVGDADRPLGPGRLGDARHAELGRQLEAAPQVPLPPPRARGVHGQRHGAEPRLDRFGEQRPGHAPVAEAVELEPKPRVGRRGRHLARPGRGQGRQAHHRPRARRRPRHPGLPVRMREPLEGDRGDQDRHRHRLAEHRRAVVTSETSTSTRGRSRQRANAATFSRSVRSSPAPPAKYPCAPGSSASAGQRDYR